MEPAEEEEDEHGAAAVALKAVAGGDPGVVELSQDAVLRFLAERGGRARNAELLEHFRGCLSSPEPGRRAQARQRFKEMVNAVAVVKQEPRDGAKYVQLRKKHWRRSGGSLGSSGSSSSGSIAQGASEAGGGGGGEKSNRRSAEGEGQEEDAPAKEKPGGRASDLEPEGEKEEGEKHKEEEGECAAPSPLSSSTSSGLALKKSRRLGSSPQLKRGSGSGGSFPRCAGEWDEEEESGSGASVALDPVEHAWMLLCASWEGRWESLEAVLSGEPALLGRRDFVTGFSCLHWAAKHGRAELLARLVGFARRRGLAVDVNARTAGGYTPLHLAAMHGRLEVVKLLVGAYDADVELRDYSGRKAAHYLSAGAAGLRSLMGSLHDAGGGEGEAGNGAGSRSGGAAGGGGRWRLSKVLPTHLLAHRPAHHEESEPTVASLSAAAEGALPAGKLSRKSSSGRAKARLHKVRFRTQIVHTTPSFRVEAEAGDGEEEEGGGAPGERPLKGSFKLRPKSNVFG